MREPIVCERSHQGLEIVARMQMLGPHWRCIHLRRAAKSVLRKSRDLSIKLLGNDRCAFIQPLGSTGVAQVSPSPDCLGDRTVCQLCRVRPTLQPYLPPGQNPGDRCLLEHEFTHQNTPWACVPPGEGSGLTGIPSNDRVRIQIGGTHKGIVSCCVSTALLWSHERAADRS